MRINEEFFTTVSDFNKQTYFSVKIASNFKIFFLCFLEFSELMRTFELNKIVKLITELEKNDISLKIVPKSTQNLFHHKKLFSYLNKIFIKMTTLSINTFAFKSNMLNTILR